MESPEEKVQIAAQIARAAQSEKKTVDDTRYNAISTGFDASSGQSVIQLSDGSIQYASSDTSGAIAIGETVELNFGAMYIDALPHIKKRPKLKTKSIPTTVAWFFTSDSFGYSKDGINWSQAKLNFGRYPNDFYQPLYANTAFTFNMFDGDLVGDIVNISGTKRWVAAGWSNPLSREGGGINPNFIRYISVSISNDNCKTWIPSTFITAQGAVNQEAQTSPDPTMTSIAYGNGLLVMCGDYGITWVSGNLGETWVQTTGYPVIPYQGSNSNAQDYIEDVRFGNGWFVQATDTGLLRASLDGVSWTVVLNASLSSNHRFYRVAYGKGIWVASGLSNFYYATTNSPDLPPVNWTAVTGHNLDLTLGNASVGAVTYGGGKFVAGGYGGTMAYSTDGANWTAIDSPFGNRKNDDMVFSIGYDKKLGWIASTLRDGTNYHGFVSTSINGIDWKPALIPSGDTDDLDFRFINRFFSVES